MSGMVIVLAILAAIVGFVVFIYNGLITFRNRFKNSFAQISVQLQRRYDLIPNLVETAKKYMQHEQGTLEKVVQARNQASNANKQATGNPVDPANIKNLSSAELTLSKSLGSFYAVMENYPDLKANQTMQQLMEELTTTENKVGFARQAFNDSVMSYNIFREKFPNIFVAKIFKFEPAELWELDTPEAKNAVKVSFN